MRRSRAVFTISQNEDRFLPLWATYYHRHYGPEDIYILDHDSTDRSIEKVKHVCQVVPVHRRASFDHNWLRDTVSCFQRFLLQSYDCVLFVEADEIVAPDPSRYPRGLGAYVEEVFLPSRNDVLRVNGFEIVHKRDEEPPLAGIGLPFLRKRRYWAWSFLYSKPLLAKVPLRWVKGFHDLVEAPGVMGYDPDLCLLHLHRLDWDLCKERHIKNAIREWSQPDLAAGHGVQNRLVQDVDLAAWFYNPELYGQDSLQLEPIPTQWKELL